MSDKRLQFLYEATKIIPKSECGTFIRCQLLSKCHTITNVNLPAQNFKASIICQGCGIELSDVPPKTFIKSPPKTTKRIKKIKKMLNKNKNLTSHQLNTYKSFADKNYQRLITICQLCHKKNISKLQKPGLTSSISPNLNNIHRMSKKKKKDLFSGLKKNAVLSVSKDGLVKKIKNKTLPNQHVNVKKIRQNNLISTASNQNTENNKMMNLDFIPLDSGQKYNLSNMKKNKNINGKNKINKQSTKLKNQNKFKNMKIQKNEVLKKTEKNKIKKDLILKNLSNILKEKPSTSNSLSSFLKNL